jgi:hypothetical protein
VEEEEQMKKNKMGGACSMFGGEVQTGFLLENLREITA